MATLNSTTFNVSINGSTSSPNDAGGGSVAPGKQSITVSESTSYSDGTGTAKAEDFFADRRTIATGANDDIDLSGGLENQFGETLTMTGVKLIMIVNQDTVNSLQVNNAVTNGWFGADTPFVASGDAITIKPGGRWVMEAPSGTGYEVTAGTKDILRITHDGTDSNSADYDIYILPEVA